MRWATKCLRVRYWNCFGCNWTMFTLKTMCFKFGWSINLWTGPLRTRLSDISISRTRVHSPCKVRQGTDHLGTFLHFRWHHCTFYCYMLIALLSHVLIEKAEIKTMQIRKDKVDTVYFINVMHPWIFDKPTYQKTDLSKTYGP